VEELIGRASSVRADTAPPPVSPPGSSARPWSRQPGGTVTKGTVANRYIPALDGIRAVAVLAVLLYHGGVPWARGGFLGVDVFFVLSGYLITALLLAEWQASGRVALGAFWARRARRLLPALFLVLVAVTIWFARWPPSGVLPDVAADTRWTLGYAANWHFLAAGESYFDQFAIPSPLRHTWSLAIEEQFYLLWPLLLVGLLRLGRGSYRLVLACTMAATAVSALLLAVWYEPADPSRVYYGTDTRAAAILVGAGAALILARRPAAVSRRARLSLDLAAMCAAVGIGWAMVALDEHNGLVFRGGIPILAVLVAVVIAATVLSSDGPIGRCLSPAPLRTVGLISYGLYLWHWPVYVALTEDRTGLGGTNLLLLRLTVTFVAAGLSYLLVEQPVRSGQWWGRRQWRALPAGAVCVGVVLLAAPAAPTPPPTVTAAPPAGRVATAVASESEPAAAPVRVLVVGDAEATALGDALGRVEGTVVRTAAAPGCGLSAEAAVAVAGEIAACAGLRNLGWQHEVARARPDVVVVADAWHEVASGDPRLAWLHDPQALSVALRTMEAAIEPLVQSGQAVSMLTAWSSAPSVGDRSFLGMDYVDRLNAMVISAAARWRDSVHVLEPPPELDRLSSGSLAAWLVPRLRAIEAGAGGDAVHAMFVGDSVSMTMTPGFVRTADPSVLKVIDRGSVGCGLLRGERSVEGTWRETDAECDDWPRRWADDVAHHRPDVVVMFFGAWETYDWRIDGEPRTWGSAESSAFALAEIEAAVQVLSSTGARVVLLTSPHYVPRQAVNQTGEWRNRYDPARIDVWNDVLAQVAASHPDRVTLVDLQGFQAAHNDEDGLRVDGVHYTPAGADVVTSWLAPQITAAAEDTP
jgi:peptidoglycan/LPS O-acetylase OafA/YrhL